MTLHQVHAWYLQRTEGPASSRTRITNGFDPLHGCLEPDLGPASALPLTDLSSPVIQLQCPEL